MVCFNFKDNKERKKNEVKFIELVGRVCKMLTEVEISVSDVTCDDGVKVSRLLSIIRDKCTMDSSIKEVYDIVVEYDKNPNVAHGKLSRMYSELSVIKTLKPEHTYVDNTDDPDYGSMTIVKSSELTINSEVMVCIGNPMPGYTLNDTNGIHCKITNSDGEVTCMFKEIPLGSTSRAIISIINDNIKIGQKVVLGVKPTNVSFAKNLEGKISISNQLRAKIKGINKGKLLSSAIFETNYTLLESVFTTKTLRFCDIFFNR